MAHVTNGSPEGRKFLDYFESSSSFIHGTGDQDVFPCNAGFNISPNVNIPLSRAGTMKDYENQIAELKKENFSLKLRIYFLEEQVQQKCNSSSEDLYRMNIELKVEVETLKHDLQEKQSLLVKASKAVESLVRENDFKVFQPKENSQEMVQEMQYTLNQKISRLEEEIKTANAETEKIAVLFAQERDNRLRLEEKLAASEALCAQNVSMANEQERRIKCLNHSLESKEELITQLERQISNGMDCSRCKENVHEEDGPEVLHPSFDYSVSTKDPNNSSMTGTGGQVIEKCDLHVEVKCMENQIKELQQKLNEKEAELALHKKNAIKRDKAIQGLTVALKQKEKEEQQKRDFQGLACSLKTENESNFQLLESETTSEGLQEGMNTVTLLRKRLEEEIRTNQELRRILEEQIKQIKGTKSEINESVSCLWDQTSYLSICLNHLDQSDTKVSAKDSPNRFAKKSRIPVLKKTGLCVKQISDTRLFPPRVLDINTFKDEVDTYRQENNVKHLQHAWVQTENQNSDTMLLKDCVLVPLENSRESKSDPDELLDDTEKTITNSQSFTEMCKEIHTGQEMCAEHCNRTSEDELEQGTYPDSSPINKNQIEILPNGLGEAESEDKKENCYSNNALNLNEPCIEPSLSSYDLLVQSQARELSIQRQKIKESHRLCVVCCKNFINILKAFDELLQASDVDYFVADAFRAHLDQSLKYIKQLESKLCHDDPSSLAQITDDEEAVGCDANSEKRSKYNGCLQRTESPDHRTPETEIAETPETEIAETPETEIAETICSSSSHQNQGSMERESQGLTPVTFAEDDAYSDHSPDKSYKTLRLVPGHHMWADNCGNYVLGLVEDFNALDKQILEGRSVVQEMEGYLGHIVYSAGAKVTDDFEIFFYEKLRRTQQSLEEASHLMKLLWRVSLPKHFTNSFSICQDEDHGKETFSARHKDWEERFSGMEKPENQTSGEIEKLILDQLALTHKVLKKARGNLEMQVYKRIL